MPELPENDPNDAETLYAQPSTIDRLIAQQRARYYTRDGVVSAAFVESEKSYAGINLRPSSQVMVNSVHRRRWTAEGAMYDWVGDI